jgi:hypothetical protein
MTNRFLVLFLCAGLSGCAASSFSAPGYLPSDVFGDSIQGEDPMVAATQDALVAFAYPARMQGNPAGMALAIASLDALAGQFSASGVYMDSNAALQLQSARSRVRQILGVPDSAQSQSLIDHLVAAAHALQNGDQPAALVALSGPDFTFGPAKTLAVLGHFPYVADADSALVAASDAEFPQDGGGDNNM